MDFQNLPDLASARVGGKALAANDDFFAPKENLLKPSEPVFIADKFTARGKWMDGWESRRRREPGHDWCLLKLGLRGRIRGVDAYTRFFTGNYPEQCSIEALDADGLPLPRLLKARWTELLPKSPLKGDSHNYFPVADERSWTHLRLNIYPDGGLARLRVYGEADVDWAALASSKKSLDLAAVGNGGWVLAASDEHFGRKENLIMPGRAPNMGDGWETRRRRGPGFDWALLKLGGPGILEKIEVDTNHFKGNYPAACSIEGLYAPGADLAALRDPATAWRPVVPRTPLAAHKRHFFKPAASAPLTHLRLDIYPDGGVSRLRVHGRAATPQ